MPVAYKAGCPVQIDYIDVGNSGEPNFAPALVHAVHGMDSGSALRLSGMTKFWEIGR